MAKYSTPNNLQDSMAKYGTPNNLLQGTIHLQQCISQQKLSRCIELCSANVKTMIQFPILLRKAAIKADRQLTLAARQSVAVTTKGPW